MSLDATAIGDHMSGTAGYRRDDADRSVVRGHGVVEVHGPDGALKQRVPFSNLITQIGEQMYGERGAGIAGAVAVPTGMQLGTGSTAVAKTGAGAAIVTLVASSLVAIGTPTSSIPGTVRRITYATTWAAGTATATGITEVALVNQSTGTQTAAPASATISRAILSPTVNKGASDSLTVTWQHDIGT